MEHAKDPNTYLQGAGMPLPAFAEHGLTRHTVRPFVALSPAVSFRNSVTD